MGSILFTLVWTTFSTDYLYRPHSNSYIAFNLIFDITKEEPLGFNTCQSVLHTDPPAKTGQTSLVGSCPHSGNLHAFTPLLLQMAGYFFTRFDNRTNPVLGGTLLSDFNFLSYLPGFAGVVLQNLLQSTASVRDNATEYKAASEEFLRRARCLTSSLVENNKHFVEIIISGWIHRLRC